jgi:hypothetical protein
MNMETHVNTLGKRIASLINRLRDTGYVFDRPDDVFPGPEPGAVEIIRRVETEIGEIPEVLKRFWLHVGSVDLSGAHPSWPELDEYLDQLVVFPASYALYYFEEEDGSRLEYDEPYQIVIAPDYFHKADVSGGPPYSVSVPALAGDPPLNGSPRQETLLQHIERSLRYGGFPGLADVDQHGWPIEMLASM